MVRLRGKSPHRFFVHRLWYSRVVQERLTVLGGRLTLHAEPVPDTPPGVQVWAAVWASQGPGYSLATRRGYIAGLGGRHRHAGEAQAAVRGVRPLARRAGGQQPFQAGALYPPPGPGWCSTARGASGFA